MKAAWLLLAILLLSVGDAHAMDVYCSARGGSLPNGVDISDDWYVVNYKVRKPQLPGQTKPITSCGISFNSVGGMYRPIEVVTRPKLGELATSYNRVSYRSAKNGDDILVIRFHRLGPSGGRETSLLTLRIHVVDKPL
jgi:hypothetical protein